MSKQNKFVGGGKIGAQIANLPNPYNAAKAGGVRKSQIDSKPSSTGKVSRLGETMGTQARSTHNDINAFTRGIKSRGPYGGPSFASINHYKKMSQSSDTSSQSRFTLPSGNGSMGATVKTEKMYGGSYNDPMKSNPAGSNQATRNMPSVKGGSSKSNGGASKVGSGKNFTGKTSMMAKAPRGVYGGGYMAAVKKGK
jgi:hypothetical protein